MKKPSFFERFTGPGEDEYGDLFEEERDVAISAQPDEPPQRGGESDAVRSALERRDEWLEHESTEGDLSVDVYQTDEMIIVKALVAGVLPSNLDIAVTRDMVTIEGTREDEREVSDDQYFQQELYWGSFTRTILLPEEIDVDNAEATEKHGILIIRLPKVNKTRTTKLKVRTR